MDQRLAETSDQFIHSMGRVAAFFGFNRVMGQLYAVLYLSEEPLSLNDMAGRLAISKASVSINVRALERWGLVAKVWRRGERRDFYQAETDIWKIVIGVLQERERREYRSIMASIGDSAAAVEIQQAGLTGEDRQVAAFYLERMRTLRDFFAIADEVLGQMLGGARIDFSVLKQQILEMERAAFGTQVDHRTDNGRSSARRGEAQVGI